MSIQNVNEQISQEFESGSIVFRIVALNKNVPTRDVGMVTTKEDYEGKLYSHLYNPLLFHVDLPSRVAYLYNCLNLSFRVPRNEIYVILWRRIGTDDWGEWFRVIPYKDSIYGEPPELITK